MENEICTKCNSKINQQPIVKVVGNGKIKKVGMNHFCTNLNCDVDYDT